MSNVWVQECGWKKTSFGDALYIKFSRYDGNKMGWRALWNEFARRYPGKWAVQFFPPIDMLVDEANYYHLYVLKDAPVGVNIDPTTRDLS